MHRDMDLVRRILMEIERQSVDSPNIDLRIDGYSGEEISYHVKIMYQAGLIEAIDFSSHDGIAWKPTSLTWEGHEFLDNARNETTWNKAKGILKDKGASASFDVMKDLLLKVATHYVTANLAGLLG
jgi:hypothetical protein